jgi:hypothetical protein
VIDPAAFMRRMEASGDAAEVLAGRKPIGAPWASGIGKWRRRCPLVAKRTSVGLEPPA